MTVASRQDDASRPARRGYRPQLLVIVITLVVCVAAYLLRTPIQARQDALRLADATDDATRAALLNRLIAAGDRGRWGILILLSNASPAIRQYGVLAAQPLRSEWSRDALFARLLDLDPVVAETAAVALAARDAAGVFPELRGLFASSDPHAARVACIALAVSGTPAATAELDAWSRLPASANHRAAIIDAAEGIGDAASGRVLLRLLDDDRACTSPTRIQRLARQVPIGALAPHGIVTERFQSMDGEDTETVSQRAAAALVRITGVNPPFAENANPEDRDTARRAWEAALAVLSP